MCQGLVCMCFLAVTITLGLGMFIKCLIDCIPLDKAWMLCHLVSGSQQTLCEQLFFPRLEYFKVCTMNKFRLHGSSKSKGESPYECEECPWLQMVAWQCGLALSWTTSTQMLTKLSPNMRLCTKMLWFEQTLFLHRSEDSHVSFLKDKSIGCYDTYIWKLIKKTGQIRRVYLSFWWNRRLCLQFGCD